MKEHSQEDSGCVLLAPTVKVKLSSPSVVDFFSASLSLPVFGYLCNYRTALGDVQLRVVTVLHNQAVDCQENMKFPHLLPRCAQSTLSNQHYCCCHSCCYCYGLSMAITTWHRRALLYTLVTAVDLLCSTLSDLLPNLAVINCS